MAQKRLRVFEGGQGRALLALAAAHRHADIGMAAVGADMDFRHLHDQQPRIVGFETDDFRQFLANALPIPVMCDVHP